MRKIRQRIGELIAECEKEFGVDAAWPVTSKLNEANEALKHAEKETAALRKTAAKETHASLRA